MQTRFNENMHQGTCAENHQVVETKGENQTSRQGNDE